VDYDEHTSHGLLSLSAPLVKASKRCKTSASPIDGDRLGCTFPLAALPVEKAEAPRREGGRALYKHLPGKQIEGCAGLQAPP